MSSDSTGEVYVLQKTGADDASDSDGGDEESESAGSRTNVAGVGLGIMVYVFALWMGLFM